MYAYTWMHTNVYIHMNTHQPVARNSERSFPCTACEAVFTRKGCWTLSTVPQRLASRPSWWLLQVCILPCPILCLKSLRFMESQRVQRWFLIERLLFLRASLLCASSPGCTASHAHTSLLSYSHTELQQPERDWDPLLLAKWAVSRGQWKGMLELCLMWCHPQKLRAIGRRRVDVEQ